MLQALKIALAGRGFDEAAPKVAAAGIITAIFTGLGTLAFTLPPEAAASPDFPLPQLVHLGVAVLASLAFVGLAGWLWRQSGTSDATPPTVAPVRLSPLARAQRYAANARR